MGLLKVDPAGLRMLAAQCQDWADEVGTVRPSGSTGMPYQATSAAVSSVNSGIDAARETLAKRVQSTAARLIAAGVDYASTEAVSAAQVRDVSIAL